MAELVENHHGESVAALSRRELQVLEMAAQGLTNPQVAGNLGVSIHAVKFHLASVYRKLGVANRTEATVVLLRGAQQAAVQPGAASEG